MHAPASTPPSSPPPARLRLESMPSEILRLVAGCFSLAPYETGDASLCPEFLGNRRTLRQLCLVSRRMWQAAAPFLYEVVVVHGPGQGRSDMKLPPLLLLLRTLVANPDLRPSLRHVACLVNLKGSRVTPRELKAVRNMWNAECVGIRIRSKADGRILELAELPTRPCSGGSKTLTRLVDCGGGNGVREATAAGQATETAPIPEGTSLEGLGERIFAAILCLAPRLDSVAFQMPRCSVAPSSLESIRCGTTSRIIDSALQDRLVGGRVLQSLTTVRVQPDMGTFMYCGWEDDEPMLGDDEDQETEVETCRGVRLDACPGLFSAPNVTTVEGFKESGGWDRLPQRTRDVRIAGLMKPDTLSTICDYPHLERLTVRPAAMDMAQAEVDDDEFNTALLKRVDTLRQLDFRTMGNETLTTSYGPERRLHCLPRLTRLEDLTIELFALFGTSDRVGTLAPLADLLPHDDPRQASTSQGSGVGSSASSDSGITGSNLRRLRLLEQWTYGDAVCPVSGDAGAAGAAYREALVEMLAGFARDCAARRMPALERFGFVRHPPGAADDGKGAEAGDRDDDGDGDEAAAQADFERLKGLFAEAGVRLEVETLMNP